MGCPPLTSSGADARHGGGVLHSTSAAWLMLSSPPSLWLVTRTETSAISVGAELAVLTLKALCYICHFSHIFFVLRVTVNYVRWVHPCTVPSGGLGDKSVRIHNGEDRPFGPSRPVISLQAREYPAQRQAWTSIPQMSLTLHDLASCSTRCVGWDSLSLHPVNFITKQTSQITAPPTGYAQICSHPLLSQWGRTCLTHWNQLWNNAINPGCIL